MGEAVPQYPQIAGLPLENSLLYKLHVHFWTVNFGLSA